MSAVDGRGAVVWLTGLPASGKSTLALRLRGALEEAGREAVVLDSDRVRAALVPAPGYDEEGRGHFYRTLANLAAMLCADGQLVVVAATAHRRAFREAARALVPRFIEVYVATPVEECRRRDPKGLYAAAASGSASPLPGSGATYEPPSAPEVTARGGEDDHAVAAVLLRLGVTPAGLPG